jgi:hypothetical protein
MSLEIVGMKSGGESVRHHSRLIRQSLPSIEMA